MVLLSMRQEVPLHRIPRLWPDSSCLFLGPLVHCSHPHWLLEEEGLPKECPWAPVPVYTPLTAQCNSV